MSAHQGRSYGPPVSTDDHHHTPEGSGPAARPDEVQHVEIRVRGLLGERWAAWFDGFELAAHDDGTTTLCGPVADQAALHGVLAKLRDLGVPLVALAPLPSAPAGCGSDRSEHT